MPAVGLGKDVVAQRGDEVDGLGSCGPVVGTTVITAVSPSGLSEAGATAATPGVSATAAPIWSSAPSADPCGTSATRSSGPFMPAPKPSASMS